MLATLTGYVTPNNVSSWANEMHVVFSSDHSENKAGYYAKVHAIKILQRPPPGSVGYCSLRWLCGANEGHCESNEQCLHGLDCGSDNCKPELGYSNKTNCCYCSYCSNAGYFNIINPISGKVLQAMTSSSGEIEIWTFSGIDNQLWFWDGVDNDVLRNKMYPHKV